MAHTGSLKSLGACCLSFTTSVYKYTHTSKTISIVDVAFRNAEIQYEIHKRISKEIQQTKHKYID